MSNALIYDSGTPGIPITIYTHKIHCEPTAFSIKTKQLNTAVRKGMNPVAMICINPTFAKKTDQAAFCTHRLKIPDLACYDYTRLV